MRLQRERAFILVSLLMVAGASWGILIWESRTMNEMSMGLTMGMGLVAFMTIWVVMMVAMMFPTVAPVILDFAGIHRDPERGGRYLAHTAVFLGAYLLLWTLFGTLAYGGALAASELAQQIPWLMMNAARIGGGILLLAGLYQLTPFKRVCLATCRTPVECKRTSWRNGFSLALRKMGKTSPRSFVGGCMASGWGICLCGFLVVD